MAKWIFSLIFSAAAGAAAAPMADGFVLSQWGNWSVQDSISALDLAQSAGAKNITVLVFLCQDSGKASQIGWCDEPHPASDFVHSMQGQRLVGLLPEIAKRGMSFNLIPFMVATGVSYRAFIWPDDKEAWFASYTEKIIELAKFSESYKASSFVVGSELQLLFVLEANWRKVISEARKYYNGPMTISAFFVQVGLIQFWDALDFIGISAYYPLAAAPIFSPVWELEAAWNVYKAGLVLLSKVHHKPLAFVEIGYPNLDVAAVMPWEYHISNYALDEDTPKRCWEAFGKVWGQESRLRFFQIWGLSSQPGDPKDFSVAGKPSFQAVQEIFRARSHLQQP